jgi:aryl-alcohol dehydrogenase-like predicted oxidoreductase
VQTEYSLFTRDVEDSVLPALRELGIGLVAYSPLGRGILTGRITGEDTLAADDSRRMRFPRFSGENLEHNLQLVARIEDMAREKGAAASQIALAWLLRQGDDVVPIPGTKHRRWLEENAGALDVQLSDDDLRRLDEAIPAGAVAGQRYADMSTVDA